MANKLELTVEKSYELADSFAQASARILDFRISNRDSLTPEEAARLERCEDSLDSMVVLFRGYGITLIGAGAGKAAEELKRAIEAGKSAIETINKVKNAIKIAEALVVLSVAVLSKNTRDVLAAAKTLKSVAKVPVKNKAGSFNISKPGAR
jgi:Ribonuclease G/E